MCVCDYKAYYEPVAIFSIEYSGTKKEHGPKVAMRFLVTDKRANILYIYWCALLGTQAIPRRSIGFGELSLFAWVFLLHMVAEEKLILNRPVCGNIKNIYTVDNYL